MDYKLCHSQTFASMDPIPEPQVESRFPDCVVMKLHLKASADDSSASPRLGFAETEIATRSVATHPQELDLSLTISFSGEQEIEVPGGKRLGLPGGRATFGIRRGQLRFMFQNCKLPLEKIALSKPFKVSLEVERQTTKSSELQVSAVLDPKSVGAKAAAGSAEKTTVEVFQVKKIGSENNPAWVFEVYDDRTVLEGLLQEKCLGVLQVIEHPCRMAADFTVRPEDVQITWGQMGRVKNIHRNKLALIERGVALRYIKPLVESSSLCAARWQHG